MLGYSDIHGDQNVFYLLVNAVRECSQTGTQTKHCNRHCACRVLTSAHGLNLANFNFVNSTELFIVETGEPVSKRI